MKQRQGENRTYKNKRHPLLITSLISFQLFYVMQNKGGIFGGWAVLFCFFVCVCLTQSGGLQTEGPVSLSARPLLKFDVMQMRGKFKQRNATKPHCLYISESKSLHRASWQIGAQNLVGKREGKRPNKPMPKYHSSNTSSCLAQQEISLVSWHWKCSVSRSQVPATCPYTEPD